MGFRDRKAFCRVVVWGGALCVVLCVVATVFPSMTYVVGVEEKGVPEVEGIWRILL
jgi:hypothetical protein